MIDQLKENRIFNTTFQQLGKIKIKRDVQSSFTKDFECQRSRSLCLEERRI